MTIKEQEETRRWRKVRLKQKAHALASSGLTHTRIALDVGVPRSTVSRWLQPPPPPMTPALRRERVRKLHLSGRNPTQIAEDVGLTVDGVKKNLKRQGFDPSALKCARNEAFHLYASGKSIPQISKQLEVSVSAIEDWLTL